MIIENPHRGEERQLMQCAQLKAPVAGGRKGKSGTTNFWAISFGLKNLWSKKQRETKKPKKTSTL